jgi:hypothetical protein
VIGFKVNTAEHAQIESAAKSQGMAVSEWARAPSENPGPQPEGGRAQKDLRRPVVAMFLAERADDGNRLGRQRPGDGRHESRAALAGDYRDADGSRNRHKQSIGE